MEVTAEVFHEPMGSLKALVSANNLDMLVTFETSQLAISP
jgi:hypothetical protein